MSRAVYRLFDLDDVLLYAGSATVPRDRLLAHFRGAPFAPYVHRMEAAWYDDDESAHRAEQAAHYTESPVFCHPAGRGSPQDAARQAAAARREHYLATAVPIPDNCVKLVKGGPWHSPGRRYITTGVAAGRLGVDSVTLLRWAHAGRVTPAWKTFGGRHRWDFDQLRAQLGMSPDGP